MLPRIEIHSQLGYIAIKTQGAKLECVPSKLTLAMQENAEAKINVKSTAPRIRIDQTRSWESAKIESPIKNTLNFEARGLQKGLERIATIAEEGVAMLRIERGGNPIKEIAARKGYKDVRLTIKSVAEPDVSAQLGTIEIQDASSTVKTNWSNTENTSRYVPGTVTITWGVEPKIEITVVPGAELSFPVAEGIGIRLDEAI